LSLFSGIKNSIAFLTIIPVGMDKDGLRQAADYMPVFPAIGGGIGLVVGVMIWAAEAVLPPYIVGMLGLGGLLLITGANHTDGLLDFGDALMSHKPREEKIRILHDPKMGTGGFGLGLVVLGTTALGIASLDAGIVIPSLVAIEAAAKFAMVFQSAAGKSAFHGMNTYFIEAMHKAPRSPRLLVASILVLVITFCALGRIGVLVSIVSVVTGAVVLAIVNRQLGGLTGDVMGATNDLARMTSLLTVVVFAR